MRLLLGLAVSLAVSTPFQQGDLAPTGTLRAAFLATNPVQGRVDAQTGAVTGPAEDLTREMARRLGVPHRMIPVVGAQAVIEQVTSGAADIGFLAYEAERAEFVDFSPPYALMGSAYLVRADGPLSTSADVERPGITIGAARGASQQIYVSEHVTGARIEVFPDMPSADAVADLFATGRIDAFAANRQRMTQLARLHPSLRVLADDFMVNGQAIVVRKGAAAQLAEVNRFLADVLGSGFVSASLEANGAAGVEAAPVPGR